MIAGKRILTNAHVVRNRPAQIFVQANGSTEKLTAQVVVIGADVDLAVLRLDDETFFNDHPPLPLADAIPHVKDEVTVYGYPLGGDQLSVTEGVSHASIIPAPTTTIAPGCGSRSMPRSTRATAAARWSATAAIVGLVFSKLTKAENIGYLVAAEEIAMFLQDIANGAYQRPAGDVRRNADGGERGAGAKLHLDKETGGMMVTEPYSKDPSVSAARRRT